MAEPVMKFRAGAIQTAVWKNVNKGKNNADFTSYSVTWERGYKDKDGKWQSSQSLMTADIPKLQLLLAKCYDWIVTAEKE